MAYGHAGDLGTFGRFLCSVNRVNVLLFDSDELTQEGLVSVKGRRCEHLRKVLHVVAGQTLRAGIVRGPLGKAVVCVVDETRVELRFKTSEPAVEPTLSLVLALPRPKALSRMVQAAASFGIRRLDVIDAWRVDPAYFKSHKLEPDVLAEDARLGCEQGATTYVPDVGVHRSFSSFVDEVLGPRLRAEPRNRLLVGHPAEPGWPSAGIEMALQPGSREPLTLVIGPDGGFIERELRTLTESGGSLVHFGDAVLRSEIALVSGLSQIALLQRLRVG
jgi:RsmE family RNA methyltransferase